MNFMIYGPFQYYQDELNSWRRIIVFHKEELRETVRQIGALTDRVIVSDAGVKASNAFADQLMVQENQFDHIGNLIDSQHQRFDRTKSYPSVVIDQSLSNQQDLLRAKMNTLERVFLRTKYSCCIFLSTFLSKQQPAYAGKKALLAS